MVYTTNFKFQSSIGYFPNPYNFVFARSCEISTIRAKCYM